MTAFGNKPLQMDVTRRGDAAVVKVSGSVSLGDSERLRERLEALAAEQVSVIVLELSEMDFISSMGLGAIISGHLKCRHHHGQIKLVRPTRPVRELLEMTRLTTLFGIYDTVEQAVSAT